MNDPITIIIPAKHEEHTIIPTLASLARYVKTPHKIIIVNVSDKKDKTADIVNTYIESRANVRLIRKIHPRGTFGMALALGFRSVKTPTVVPFMADACDDPRVIDRMYAKIMENWDVVSASRYMEGGKKIGGPAVQSFFSKTVGRTLHLFTGVPTSDISNALKMYRKSMLDRIFVSAISGVEASMEIALQAYFLGAKITEIPTVWRGRTAGRSKFKPMERAPRYARVYLWALVNTVRKKFRKRPVPLSSFV